MSSTQKTDGDYYDNLAKILHEKYACSIVDDGNEDNPYDWWLEDVTVQDIVDLVLDYNNKRNNNEL